ncbi:MAG: hypothetical protein ACT4P7_16085 [Gemmatimonadaceae bacterium]
MRIRSVMAVTAAMIVMASATAAQAQTGAVHMGPRVTYNFDFEEAAVGFHLGLPLGSRLDFYPSVEFFFPDRGSLLGFNGDIKLRPLPRDAGMLYIGTGLNLTRASFRDVSNTEAGLNLLAGLEGRTGAIHPFVELRSILADRTSVQLTGGLNITIGTR